MSRFVNKATQVVFSVDDSKDGRYDSNRAFARVESDGSPVKKVAAAKAVAAKSE